MKPQKIKKTKEEIMKHVKKYMMCNEIANQDTGNAAKNVKSLEEVMEVSEEMEKLSEVIYAVIYGLPTKKVKFLKDFNGITL